jgi:hypothetical protein
LEFFHSRIQGFKKAPDPGSGSATLLKSPKIKARKTNKQNNISNKRNTPDPSEMKERPQTEIKGTVA